MEEIEKLKNEVQQYIILLDSNHSEKIALDQLLVENIKNLLLAKKDIVMLNNKLEKASQENDQLNKLIKEMKNCNKLSNDSVDPCLEERN